MQQFVSSFEYRGTVALPAFSGIRCMMMPLVIGEMDTVPAFLNAWRVALASLFEMSRKHTGAGGYITIDEKIVNPGETHRRRGLHVDGIYRGNPGSWGGGGPGGPWGAPGTGMLTVASVPGCRAWRGTLAGRPGDEGECDHLKSQCSDADAVEFGAGKVYWLDGLCVHESMPMIERAPRQFVRLSMPSTAPWFEGYTVNPLGIEPTGPILPRREFMDT